MKQKGQKKYIIRKNLTFLKEARLHASKIRNKKFLKKTKRYKLKHMPKYRDILRRQRNKIRKSFFRNYDFSGKKETFMLADEIGIESENAINNFIDLGQKIIDSNSMVIELDLTNCRRLWPSTITLLCSLMQWRTLAAQIQKKNINPQIRSNKPNDKQLEDYLTHCGFYKYVGVKDNDISNIYKNEDIVKIHRENDNCMIEQREQQVIKLIKNKSALNDELIERVQCQIIPEILNNVVEHGETTFDKGWWIIGQYHEKHKIISICIADNGIGFRKNLATGPQKDDITKMVDDISDNDSKFIQLALEKQVSGAWDAKTKEKILFRTEFPNGKNRGNGLKEVKKACALCGIQLSVFSHYGYCIYGANGDIIECENFKNRIFAGTMYNLIIPAK